MSGDQHGSQKFETSHGMGVGGSDFFGSSQCGCADEAPFWLMAKRILSPGSQHGETELTCSLTFVVTANLPSVSTTHSSGLSLPWRRPRNAICFPSLDQTGGDSTSANSSPRIALLSPSSAL